MINSEKQLILKNFLKNAAFEEWSENCLKLANQKSGFKEGYWQLLFPNELEDLTKFFHQNINQQMREQFKECSLTKAHEKIIYLLELKFKLYQPHKEAVRALMKYNLNPKNIAAANSMLWDSCNLMWRLAGDKSTDYNYYTKRALLAGIYGSSMLYWLNDNSQDFCQTKIFIRNRINNVLSLGKLKKSITAYFSGK